MSMATLRDPESKAPSTYSRKDKSLSVLCTNFLRLYNREGVESIGLDNAANQLGVERRRIYDIVNILESVGILTRKAKNQYNWKGFGAIPHALEELEKQAFSQNFKITPFCNFAKVINENDYRGHSNSNNLKTDRPTKTSGFSKSDNNRKEKSLGLLTQNFIKLLMISKADLITLDYAATALLGESHNPAAMRTAKVRRLYDIANVFSSMNLLVKVRHPETGRSSYRWVGVNGDTKPKPLSLDTNTPKQRAFGTDITNHGSKRHVVDSLSDWISKDNKGMVMHTTNDVPEVECDENLTKQQHQHNSKEFVFGPFSPVTAHKAGTSGNKKFKQAQDFENLADTYRPQYRNKALSDLFGHYVEAWKSWYVEAANTTSILRSI